MALGAKLAFAGALGVAWAWIAFSSTAQAWLRDLNGEFVADLIGQVGAMGPVVVIGLMAIAIVASPIPSAPIALAAGAAYGHTAGTVYVAIGSELGAMLAFLIGRYLGHDAVRKLMGEKMDYGLLGSQAALTVVVFGSRLLPFVSFDGVSYAAGLSRLHLWRFLVATLAGILPASFLLAHFGAVAASGSFGAAEWIVTGLGLLTALPLIGLGLRRARGDRTGPTTTVKSASSSSLAETSVDGVEDRPENDRDIPPP